MVEGEMRDRGVVGVWVRQQMLLILLVMEEYSSHHLYLTIERQHAVSTRYDAQSS